MAMITNASDTTTPGHHHEGNNKSMRLPFQNPHFREWGDPIAEAKKYHGNLYTLTFVGDTLLADPHLDLESSFSKVSHLLEKSDYVVGSLNGPIVATDRTTRDKFDWEHPNEGSLHMDPRGTHWMREAGIQAVNLANEHYLDHSATGMEHTVLHLEQANIASFGIGETLDGAARPLFIQTQFQDVSIGVTAFSVIHGNIQRAGDVTQPVGVMEPTFANAAMAIQKLQDLGTTTNVAFVHWNGKKSQDIRVEATNLVQAGFDLIIGHDGAGLPAKFLLVHGKPVLTNLGNFVWHPPTEVSRSTRVASGVVVHALVNDSGTLTELKLYCVENLEGFTRPCLNAEARQLYQSLSTDGSVLHKKGDQYASIPLVVGYS